MDITGSFKGADWFSNNNRALVGGCGGIGSWLTLLLARANVRVYVYDDDTLEDHNFSGQAFFTKHLGDTKTSAISDVVEFFCGTSLLISTYTIQYTKESSSSLHVFGAFDNMQARQTLFENWKNRTSHLSPSDASKAILIDGRLHFDFLEIFCVTTDNMEEYEKNHLGLLNLEKENCTKKQTSFCASMIASHMVAFYTNHLSNCVYNAKITTVPFHFKYYIPLNKFEIVE